MLSTRKSFFIALVMLSLFGISGSRAVWDYNSAPVCVETGGQYVPQLVNSKNGSVIVTWHDNRHGNLDIYAARIDSLGDQVWDYVKGRVCSESETQMYPVITTDGDGGAIIAWRDNRNGSSNYDIYAQRLNEDGIDIWTMHGKPICTATGHQDVPQIISDGVGGAIIVWTDERGGTLRDIYAQRIDELGNPLWIVDGVAVCTAVNGQSTPTLVSDGSNGAFITWTDPRGSSSDIYAQRIDASGSPLWAADGVAICSYSGSQESPQILSHIPGEVIISWKDHRGSDYDIYAQRVNSNGTIRWNVDGVIISAEVSSQYDPRMTTDGGTGVIIGWKDYRSGSWHAYAQKIDSTGSVQWTAGGTPVCTATIGVSEVYVSSDSTGGAYVTWVDERHGADDIYGQRIDSDGIRRWHSDGIPMCDEGMMQAKPQISTNIYGNSIVTWSDMRTGTYNIYAQKIDRDGNLQWVRDDVHLCRKPNDQTVNDIAPDISGGAFIVWEDARHTQTKIFAQKVDRYGNIKWKIDGTPICTTENNHTDPKVVSDGLGGAIIVWSGNPNGGNATLWAQHISGGGEIQWSYGGIPVCTRPTGQLDHQVASDGTHGVIVTWYELGGSSYYDIFAQRVDRDGIVQWGTDGIAVCKASGRQDRPQIVSYGSSSAIITWEDDRGTTGDVYAQRIDLNGTPQWTANGVLLCDQEVDQKRPALASDGAGGAIVAFADPRFGGDDLFAQHIDVNGNLLWTSAGISICTVSSAQGYPELIPDDAGGAIIIWRDYRNGAVDIFIQRVNSSGTPLWIANGMDVTTLTGAQSAYKMTSDGAGGAIVTWVDSRTNVYDIYAQRIDAIGSLSWSPSEGVAVCTKSNRQLDPVIAMDGLGGAIIAWTDERDPALGYNAVASGVNFAGVKKVPTLLQNFTASASFSRATITWALSKAGKDMQFFIVRRDRSNNTDNTLPSTEIVEDKGTYTFVDRTCTPGSHYTYRVDVFDEDGRRALFETEELSIPVQEIVLHQNYPNPFNPSTTISFTLPVRAHVELAIYDVSGKRLATLLNQPVEAEPHKILWDGKNTKGNAVGSGVYFYRLKAGKEIRTRKMVLMK